MVQVLSDRYELGDVLGTGGMGAVYRAHDRRLNRTVAVKVLRGGPLADSVAQSRMRSEAQLAGSIHHPGVAQVFDFGEDHAAHGGLAYIVMQYVEGHSLGELLRAQGPMPADQVMSVVAQVAEALQAAHDVGIVHRDLKPANIMLTPAGRTVLVDFGIARSASSEPLTATGTILGTADYFSPEQASGRPATPQSDLYSLGVVAHHCLTGTSPFRRESHLATALAHLNDDLPELDETTPDDVRALIASMTAKDPSDRPSTAAAAALLATTAGAATTVDLPETLHLAAPPVTGAVTEDVPPAPTAALHAPSGAATVQSRRPAPRRRTTVYAGVAAVVALLALLGIRQMTGGDPLVPDVVGLSTAAADSDVQDAGMTSRRVSVDVANVPAGRVVRQSPPAGADRPDDRVVTVTVASGKVRVSADSLVGKTYAEASAALEKLGLVVARRDVTTPEAVGDVVSLDKSGRLPDGSTVTLSIGVAPTAPSATAPGTSTSGPSGNTSPGNEGKGKGGPKGKKK